MSDRVIEVTAPVPYPVLLCDDAQSALFAHLDRHFPKHSICVISDDVVAKLYAKRIADALAKQREPTRLLSFPNGEWSKSREVWSLLTDAMIDARFGRDSVVVAIGGGVTGDLAGFVAATYMRGVPVVQVPTSLAAMVDASIGGKAAVDVPGGKNLVGAFHPPSAVIVDPGALRTLPVANLKEGLVEALKHGAIVDADYFDWILARTRAGALAREGGPDAADARRLVERSVEIKTQVVSEDPREEARRSILNFGHTVGHAIERASGYAVSHGQAVAHGMIVEARIGEAMGATEPGTAAKLEEAVRALEISAPPDLDPNAILDSTRADKKNREAAIRMTLIRRIGEVARGADGAWTHEVEPGAIRTALG